jgi:hypothetical protein
MLWNRMGKLQVMVGLNQKTLLRNNKSKIFVGSFFQPWKAAFGLRRTSRSESHVPTFALGAKRSRRRANATRPPQVRVNRKTWYEWEGVVRNDTSQNNQSSAVRSIRSQKKTARSCRVWDGRKHWVDSNVDSVTLLLKRIAPPRYLGESSTYNLIQAWYTDP